MPIKRTAPVSTQQELQVSAQVVYRFKPTPDSKPASPAKPASPETPQNYLKTDLLKTILTTALIVAIVLVVVWRGWLK